MTADADGTPPAGDSPDPSPPPAAETSGRPGAPTNERDTLLRLATVGPAHGLRGDVRLVLHTDDPEQRLAPGTQVHTEPADRGPLTVAALWVHRGLHHARFHGHEDRTAAEALRGLVLHGPPVPEPEAWYPHELRGLRACSPQGAQLGQIDGVQHLPAQDVLVLRMADGQRALVPFVSQIVPEVDVQGGTVTIDAPPGLLPGPEAEQ